MAKTDEDLRLERELFVRALMPTMRGDGAARLATLLTPREVPADTILYREGEPPDEFFFLVEGQVVMEADGIPTWTFGDRSLLGVMDMTAWRPHRRTCRTTRPTRLLAGHSTAWLNLLDDDPVMGEDAVYSFAQRLEASRLELGHLLAPAPIAPDPGVILPLALHEKALALRDTPLLARASTQAIASLAQIADELTFDAGEEVFAFGHGERALFFVVRGVLELTLHAAGAGRVTRVGPACSLATAAALSGQLGQYSARAVTAAIVLRVREEDYFDQSDEHPDLTRAAMAYMASELEKLLDLKPPTD